MDEKQRRSAIEKIRNKIIDIENGKTNMFVEHWENNLPPYLHHDINALIEGKKKQV